MKKKSLFPTIKRLIEAHYLAPDCCAEANSKGEGLKFMRWKMQSFIAEKCWVCENLLAHVLSCFG